MRSSIKLLAELILLVTLGSSFLYGGDCAGPETTRLHDHARKGDLQAVRNLVEKNGEDVNQLVCNGDYPVTWAAAAGQFDVVDYLLKKGAKADPYDVNGNSPLGESVKNRHFNIAGLLMKYVDLDSNSAGQVILSAVESSDISLLQLFLNKGLDINSYPIGPFHPTQAAVTHERTDVLKFLLSKGANPNSNYQGGMSLLHFASSKGNSSLVELLIKYGADPNAIWKIGDRALTPIDAAISEAPVRIAKLLVANGANVTRENIKNVEVALANVHVQESEKPRLKEILNYLKEHVD